MKIGILTYHRSVNHGAFLQAYCLARSLHNHYKRTCRIEVIDYTSKKAYLLDWHIIWNKTDTGGNYKKFLRWLKFNKAVQSLPLSAAKLISDDLDKVRLFMQKHEWDIIIVGSDEVWKTTSVRGFPSAYWLNFPLEKSIRVAYAVSSRSKLSKMNKRNREYIRNAVEQFTLLGIRDDITVNELGKITDKKCIMCCDPTFTVNFKMNKARCKSVLREKLHLFNDKKIMGVMLAQENIVEELKRVYGDRYYIVSIFEQLKSADYNHVAISPFEFLETIAGMDCFVTTRFHGAVFAIKFGIPFLAIDDYDSYERSRLRYLLDGNGMRKHLLIYQEGEKFAREVCSRLKECIEEQDFQQIAKLAVKAEREKFKTFLKEFDEIVERTLEHRGD